MAKPVMRINRDNSACMYTEHFKLSEPPFSLTPDPRYLFMSERHREGLAHLFYGVQQPGGFVQLTGEIGCGKTTLSRCLVRQLPPETDVALILNPRLTAIELLATVCDELRIPYPAETGSIKVLIDALNQHLLESHAQRRKTVLIIDEAQNLQGDVLEQIRLLTNLETSQEKLLQIILIGQPELLSILKRKELRQIAQRVTARYHLLALSRRETYAYIHHRLLVAGMRDPLFTSSAMRSVYRLSGGVPRLVNILCDRALLGAYALDRQRVSAAIVRRAGRETRGVVPWYRKHRLAWISGIAALLVLAILGAIIFNLANLSFLRHEASAVPARQTKTEKLNDRRFNSPETDGKATLAAAPVKPDFPPGYKPDAPERQTNPATAITSRTRLPDLLSGSSSSFSDLYSRWGLKTSLNSPEAGCKAVKAQGFECLFGTGSWPKLRRYNVPAILEILLPTGARKRVTLIGLDKETATLVIAGREYAFPLSEVDLVWDGSFILLWKPPFPPPHRLTPGATGDNVLWVRRALDTVEKKTAGSASVDLYDDELRQRILRFQREQSLIQDGFVGNETLVRLTLALNEPNTPSLSKGTR